MPNPCSVRKPNKLMGSAGRTLIDLYFGLSLGPCYVSWGKKFKCKGSPWEDFLRDAQNKLLIQDIFNIWELFILGGLSEWPKMVCTEMSIDLWIPRVEFCHLKVMFWCQVDERWICGESSNHVWEGLQNGLRREPWMWVLHPSHGLGLGLNKGKSVEQQSSFLHDS